MRKSTKKTNAVYMLAMMAVLLLAACGDEDDLSKYEKLLAYHGMKGWTRFVSGRTTTSYMISSGNFINPPKNSL